jgi:glycosyltransferase involved in cell wall biosynthesis
MCAMSAKGAPLVGVVVVARNMARHVSRCLESILNQEPRPHDVLVIDGHSQDGTAAFAKKLPGVRVLEQHKTGLANGRNQGLREVVGDLIAFCDADDRWPPNALEARLAAMRIRPDAIAVIGRVIFEEIKGEVPTAAQRERFGHKVAGYTPGALLARREIFEMVGHFDETLTIGADADWFVRLRQSGVPWIQTEAITLQKGARCSSLSTNVADYRRELLTVARRYIHRSRT